MALLTTSHCTSLFSSKSPSSQLSFTSTTKPLPPSVPFSCNTLKPRLLSSDHTISNAKPIFPSISPLFAISDDSSDQDSPRPLSITDEWGEKSEHEPENPSAPDADPPENEDEWEEGYTKGSASTQTSGLTVEKDGKVEDLKRRLVDTVYGTNFGFRTGTEVRAEVLEIVNQLEALNPTPDPVDSKELLNGNWVLVYTSFSELLPLLAVGTLPLLNVERISQAIETSNLSIVNSITLSSPFATYSFSASATFEVRSPSRIQVEFKEGTFQPPEIKSNVDIPDNVDVFGQNINLSPVQQALNPLQDAVANISGAISGQSPLKVPIPGNRSTSWLLITYLDEDLRISRGDGGLFVLAREGSPLLSQ
ncbi:hypothetical protein K2173_009588 [Erythroxylum novogranatense]|uniref:Plastid lipid-associated protein/fibrillin conserved domain-containing protein n=1 Tax=Erythroxylum novogranatense TaxID=1862640 RepID=A0AAV8U4B4_9ROSI|nr:hypothetical protein K2173_009588 [Erythroxylum novogranatense]